MEAGLNQINGGQTKQNGHQKSQHRTQSIKHTGLSVLITHSLKYKKTVSQKTSYGYTELQIQVLIE